MAIALELLIAFVERATANMGDFQLSDGDAPTVAEICRKLDGLPVAIEFATARVAPFSVLSRNGLEFDGAVSGRMRIRGQAARSIGLAASFWFRVCHPSTLRMVI